MITYVDTSTLVKLVVEEPGSDRAAAIWEASDSLVSVVLVRVEARAALAATTRAGRLSRAQHRRAESSLAQLVDQVGVVAVSESLVDAAGDLAGREALRGYDALHLAAALLVRADVLTSADAGLCAAAGRCGLHVADPTEPG